MPLPARKRLGSYEIVSLVGSGGMGEVYRAHDLRLDRTVALKVLPPAFASDHEMLRRFEQEARAASALNHPNIVTIFDIGSADGVVFYVMELVIGRTLRALIADQPPDVERTLDISIQVAEGLGKAHEAGIIHRDLKPENVLLSDDGFAKIVDFGLAKLSAITGAGALTTIPRMATASGLLLGTVGYMSPEQAAGRRVQVSSDIFSFGTMLYEMLTGRHPFERTSAVQTMSAIIEAQPERASQVNPEIPPALDALVERLLIKAPDARPDARVIARDLRAVKAGRSRPPSSTPTPPRTVPAGDRRQVTVVIAQMSEYAALIDRLGAEAAERLKADLELEFRAAMTGGGGAPWAQGDTFFALFGVSVMLEDDSVRAARAACAFRDRARSIASVLRDGGAPLVPRVAMASGDVVVIGRDEGSGAYRCAGEVMQLVTRLLDLAEPGEILANSDVHRLIDGFVQCDSGPLLKVKGRTQPSGTYRVLRESGASTRLEAEERRGLTPFTGRQRELALLRDSLDLAREGRGQTVKVTGEPGIGKSRLMHEFRAGLPDADVRVLVGRCLPHGAGLRYWPFLDPLRQILGFAEGLPPTADHAVATLRAIDETLPQHLAFYLDALSITAPSVGVPSHLKGEDLRLAFQEALATLITLTSAQKPVVLLLDDWQWADTASDQLLASLTALASAYPLLVVVTSRPEAAGGAAAAFDHSITLSTLDVAASQTLIASVLHASRVEARLSTLLFERTGGNPLFIEELCRTLREDESVTVTGGVASSGDAVVAAQLPDTIQAVLRSRLDRLSSGARAVIRVASVIGREFGRQLLSRVVPDASTLIRDLEALKTARMIQPVRLAPDPQYRFHHALIHDVTYQSLLLHQRRDLHRQVAEAILAVAPEPTDEQCEALARHFAEAEVWEAAARHGLAAAERAVRQSQFAAARDLLDRVLDCVASMPAGAPRYEIEMRALFELERACETLGAHDRQQELIDRLLQLATQQHDQSQLAEVLVRQGELRTLQRRFPEALEALDEALAISRSLGDDVRVRGVLRSLSFAHWQAGDFERAIAANSDALTISRRLGDRVGESKDLSSLAAALKAAGRLDEALDQVNRALELQPANSYGRVYPLHIAGTIYRALGRTEDALAAYEEELEAEVQFRALLGQGVTLLSMAPLYVDKGDVEGAIALYDRAANIYRGVQNLHGLSRTLKMTADTLAGIGRYEEALSRASEGARLFERIHDWDNAADTWWTVAQIAEKNSDSHTALEEALQRFVELHRDRRSPRNLIQGLLALARVSRGRGAPTEHVTGLYDDALRAAREERLPTEEANVLNSIGILHWNAGQFEQAAAAYRAALGVTDLIGDAVHSSFLMNSLAASLRAAGNTAEARTWFESALARSREAGAHQVEAHALAGLGDLALETGNAAEAADFYEASLALRRQLADRRGEGWMQAKLAHALTNLGQADRANQLRSQARAIADAEGDEKLRRTLDPLGS